MRCGLSPTPNVNIISSSLRGSAQVKCFSLLYQNIASALQVHAPLIRLRGYHARPRRIRRLLHVNTRPHSIIPGAFLAPSHPLATRDRVQFALSFYSVGQYETAQIADLILFAASNAFHILAAESVPP